jgi:hypothetical protein
MVNAGTGRLPLYTAGLAVIVAMAIAGCNANSSSSAGAGSGGSSSPASGSASAAPANALDAVKLAAKTATGANSFTGTMDMQATVKPGAASSAGAVSMNATFAEQLHPSLLVSVNIASLSSAGTSLPGGLTEIITPVTLYMKWPYLTQNMHLTKPWLAIPVSSVSQSTGIDLGQIFSQATGSGPLAQSQLLAGATSVRQVGTGSIDGVPVTEYTGTIALDKGLAFLSGSTKTEVQQQMAADGFTTATFDVWIDGQHISRKAVVTEVGKTVTETITTTITSINQPVNIAVPPTDQTSPVPTGT